MVFLLRNPCDGRWWKNGCNGRGSKFPNWYHNDAVGRNKGGEADNTVFGKS